MTDLKLIEAFVLVMKCGTLTAAELESGIPKATLSRQLMRLEEELGAQLFLRSTRRTVPTQAAQALYTHGVRLLAEVGAGLEEAKNVVRDVADGARGELTVVTSSHFSTSFVSQILGKFLLRHPAVICHLDVVIGEPVASVADNVDCYVCSVPPDHPNLVARLLGHLTYRLFASPAYLRKHGEPQGPEDLAVACGIVFRQAAHDTRLVLHSQGRSVTCDLPIAASTNDYWIMKSMAVDGHGITLLPEYFARPEIAAGMLCPVLPDWQAEPVPVYCVYPKQRYVGKKLRGFIDLMTDSFEQIASFQYYVVDRLAQQRSAALCSDDGAYDGTSDR